MKYSSGRSSDMSEDRRRRRVLLICDRGMEIQYKSAMCVIVVMWNVHRRVIWKGRNTGDIGHHRFNDNENRRTMLKEEELNRRSTCQ